MDDGDLNRHDDATHDPRFAPEEIGHDHEFPVPRPERVDGAVGERDRKGEEEGAEILAPLDGVHMEGDLGVGAALKTHQEVRDALEEAALFLDDLDRDGDRRCAVGLRERERRRQEARQHRDSRDEQRRERAAASRATGSADRQRLSLTGKRNGLGMTGLRPLAARDAERASR